MELIINKYPQYQDIDKVIYGLATIYLLSGEHDKSYQYYSLLLKYNTKLKGKAVYSLAKILTLKKDYVKAREIITENIRNLKKDDYFFKVAYLNGEIRFYEGEYQKAISLLTYIKDKIKSMREEEQSIKPRLLLRLGQCHFYKKEYNKAREYFVAIIKEYPHSPEARFAKNWTRNIEQRSFLHAKDSFFSPFIIQAGVFSKHNNALIIQKKMQKLKLNPVLISSQKAGSNLHKIIIPVASQKDANIIIRLLKENAINAIILKQ